jgi:hypothetical protein
MEQEVLAASLSDSNKERIARNLDGIRRALVLHAQNGHLRFFDASRLFCAEQATTFCDLWHFSDPGHAILGHALATEVSAILKSQDK